MKPDYTYRASLVRVTDGDTVVLTLDMGLRMSATVPIRLFGVDAPEMNTPEGKHARAWVLGWFEDRSVVCQTRKDPEKYGRWLGVVVDERTGEVLNNALVANGHAIARWVDQ